MQLGTEPASEETNRLDESQSNRPPQSHESNANANTSLMRPQPTEEAQPPPKKNIFLTNKRMQSESESDNVIDNIRFMSKKTLQEPQQGKRASLFGMTKSDTLNYGGRQSYNEQYEISFELKEQLEHLEMIKRYIEQRFSNRTPEVNFFLDDSNEQAVDTTVHGDGQISKMEDRIKSMLQRNEGPFNGTCLRDTWSKGRTFFFVNAGDYIKVHSITENGKYAHCEFDEQFGILHVNDIRIYGHVYNSVDQQHAQ